MRVTGWVSGVQVHPVASSPSSPTRGEERGEGKGEWMPSLLRSIGTETATTLFQCEPRFLITLSEHVAHRD